MEKKRADEKKLWKGEIREGSGDLANKGGARKDKAKP